MIILKIHIDTLAVYKLTLTTQEQKQLQTYSVALWTISAFYYAHTLLEITNPVLSQELH